MFSFLYVFFLSCYDPNRFRDVMNLACTEKVFSFLSKDEVEKLKQEEEKKIATLKRDKKHEQILKATGGNSLDASEAGAKDDDDNDDVDGSSSDSGDSENDEHSIQGSDSKDR